MSNKVLVSPTAHKRSPPLLFFIIDLHNPYKLPDYPSLIHSVITQQLFYFYLYVDKRLTWTYQLFHSCNKQKIVSQKLPMDFTLDALLELHVTLTRNFSTSSDMNSFQMSSVLNGLERGLEDLKWDWNASIARMSGILLSPPQFMKSQGTTLSTSTTTLQPSFIHYKVRNYVYLVSSLPRTEQELSLCIGKEDGNVEELESLLTRLQNQLFGSSQNASRLLNMLIEKRSVLSVLDIGEQRLEKSASFFFQKKV